MVIIFHLFFENLLLFSKQLKLTEDTFLGVLAHRLRARLLIDT